MPSTRELRRRIKSVNSTRQITKAMELVAASKMRRATEAAVGSRPYQQKLGLLVQRALADLPSHHPLFKKRPVRKLALLIISSDRGLAGAHNTAILKQAFQIQRERKAQNQEVSVITLGKKVEASLNRLGWPILESYPHPSSQPNPAIIRPISRSIINSFINQEFDEVAIIYTEFISALHQEARIIPLLPLIPPPQTERLTAQFLFEPSSSAVLDQLLPRSVETSILHALQEALASEHSARRMAMKTATDNASEMIDDLTLTYNGVRQSAITQELAEITSGSAGSNS